MKFLTPTFYLVALGCLLLQPLPADEPVPLQRDTTGRLDRLLQKAAENEEARAAAKLTMQTIPPPDGLCVDGCTENWPDACAPGDLSEEPPRLRGSLKFSQYYDSNPGAFPTAAAFQQAFFPAEDSAGNLYEVNVAYDVFRSSEERLTAGTFFHHTSNYDTHEFDIVLPSGYLEYARRISDDVPVWFSLLGTYDYYCLDSEPLLSTFRVRPTVGVQVTEQDVVLGYFQYEMLDFKQQGAADGSAADQDSDTFRLGLSWLHNLSETAGVSLGYEGVGNASEGSDYDYHGHSLLTGFYWQPNDDWTLRAIGGITWRDYANPNFVFGDIRADQNYRADLILTRHLTKEIDVFGQYTLNRNDSNLLINEFDRHIGQVGILCRF